MAVGDVVNNVIGNTTVFSFQPAAGVEVCITSFMAYMGGPPEYYSLTNGVTLGILGDGSAPYGPNSNVKYMINNTNYITGRTTTLGGYYTGIQIK